MAAADYISTVQGFYVSYYGRPADPAGLTYWTERLNTEGGNLNAILNAFGTSAEATRRFGTGTNDAKIQAIYQQTFGRAADAEGLAFYNGELTAGRITLIDVAKRVIDGAKGDDVAIRANRLAAAQTFTTALNTDAEKAGYSGSGAEDAARSWISTVTKDAATLTAAQATVDATITSLLPQTFTLTTNQDKWTGSAGNDTVSGGTSSLAASDTLGITDQIDGGAGTDTLSLAVGKSFAGFQVGTGFLKNVEVVNLTNSSPTVYSFAAKGVTGVTNYNVTGPVNVTGIDSLSTAVSLKTITTLPNAAVTAVTVSFADELVSGSSDAASLSVESLGRASSSTTDPFDFDTAGSTGSLVNVTAPSIERLNIAATANNFLSFAGSTALKDLVVTGAGAVLIDGNDTVAQEAALPATTRTVDGSAMTGTAQFDLSGRAANGLMTSVKTGSGNDTIVIDTNSLRADATIAGGDGTDTLRINNGATPFGSSAFSMSGVETLLLAGTSGTVNFSGSSTTGLGTVQVNGTQTGNVTVSGLGANAVTLNLNHLSANGTDGSAAISVENTGTAKMTLSGATSSANAVTLTDFVTFSKATALEVEVPTNHTWTPVAGTNAVGISAPEATSVKVSGGGRFNDTYTSTTNHALGIAKATSLTIDQSSATTTDIGGGTTAGWQVGVLGDTSTPTLKTLSVTSKSSAATRGVDLLAQNSATTHSFQNLESLTVDTASTFDFATTAGGGTQYDLAKITSVTLGGATNSSKVELGNLGANDLPYGIGVTATGLKGGLQIGDIKVGSGQAINLNIKGLLDSTTAGTTTAGVIGALQETSAATNVRAGSITVDGTGMGYEGNFEISKGADVFSKVVTIDLTGSQLANTVQIARDGATPRTITADTVVIKAPSAPTSFEIGNITTANLTYVGPSTVAASTTIGITTSSSAFTANLTAGLGQDVFSITGGSTTATYTVTGDLKDNSSDSVTLTAAAKSGSTGVTIDMSGLRNVESTTLTGSANKDTITGTAGDDIIRGGVGGDVLTGGAGKDLFRVDFATETGSALSATAVTRSGNPVDFTAATSYKFTANDYVSTANMDKVNDFLVADGDMVQIQSRAAPSDFTLQSFGQVFGTGKNLASSLSSQTDTQVTGKADVFVTGNYDSANDRFTFSSSGTSTLYLFDLDKTVGAGQQADVYGIVLVGYVSGSSASYVSTGPTNYTAYTGLLAGSLLA